MKTLERVRGSSRFESTAAEEGCAGTLYVRSDLCDLFLCLDGAGTCDDLKAAAADLSDRFRLGLLYKNALKMDIPVFGWYLRRKTGTASCIRLRVSGNKKPVSAAIANTGSAFSFTFPKDLKTFGRRGLFFAAETVRAVIIARKIIKRIGCKKIHHLVLHICCSLSLKITAGFILSGC